MEKHMPFRRYQVCDVRGRNGNFLTRGGAKIASLTKQEVKYLLEQAMVAPRMRNRWWER